VKQVEFIKRLKDYNKPYYSLTDLQVILGVSREVAKVVANRFSQAGVLERLASNTYVSPLIGFEVELVANTLYSPSYLSFESALARYGILSQIPYTLTFATTRRPKKISLGGREVEYRKIKPELFFGYDLVGRVYIAAPEKALLDAIYFATSGKGRIYLEDLSLRNLSKERFQKYARRFPAAVQRQAKELAKGFGEVVATIG